MRSIDGPGATRRRVARRALAALLLTAAVAARMAARAQEGAAAGSLVLVSGDARGVALLRDGARLLPPAGGGGGGGAAAAALGLQAGDRVLVRDPATRVRLDLPWRAAPLLLEGPDAAFVVPPPPEPGMPRAWQASYEGFWQVAAVAAAVPAPPRRTRGVPLPPGSGADGAPAAAPPPPPPSAAAPPPLRPRDGLPLDGARVLAGPGGLALAWAGGVAPFAVSIAAADGRVLAQGTVPAARHARFADLVVPAGAPLTVTLRDAEGQSLSARLQPEPRLPPAFPAGAAAAAPVAYAIALYEEAGPQWRLEALRRLLDRAAARDHLAVMAAQRILGGTAL